MKTRRLIVVAAVVVGLGAGAARASNMAFALRVQLGGSGQQELRFLALPYLYEPATAEELCADLGGAEVVAKVMRWDEAASQFVVHPCGTGTEDFALAEGMAYGVRNLSGAAIDGLLVGRHDPGFSLDLAAGPGSNLSWISPPCTSPPFDDVPCWKWFAPWVAQLKAEEITQGCGGGNYCPFSHVTRAQMAKFLTVTFDLKLNGD